MWKDSSYQAVCSALGRQLGVDKATFRAHEQLAADLGLRAVDLDMIALWLEEMEGIEIPSEQIGTARTVGQLVHLLRAWKRRDEADDAAERNQRMLHFVGTLPRARGYGHKKSSHA